MRAMVRMGGPQAQTICKNVGALTLGELAGLLVWILLSIVAPLVNGCFLIVDRALGHLLSCS
jgi:hypothetical protein